MLGSGNPTIARKNFSVGDGAAMLPLLKLFVNQIVQSITVYITTPFDTEDAQIQLGTTGTVNLYGTIPGKLLAGTDTIRFGPFNPATDTVTMIEAALNYGSATVGAGSIVVEVIPLN